MKITKYGSATVLLESADVSVLCDPWLTDGAYYGAWCNFPPIDLTQCDFSAVDFVYISHIHPDHFDPATMALLDKKTPVLIHRYHQGFLKASIERLGFEVIELENGKPFALSPTTRFSIFAADDCDPRICGNLFGCITREIKGSMQLDSLCVMEENGQVLVNTNDCPYGIAKNTLKRIKGLYPKIDFALIGYTSASLFPHCMMDYSAEQRRAGQQSARMKGLMTGLNTLHVLAPRYYMPFAGTYILGGYNADKNAELPAPELQEAVAFFQADSLVRDYGSVPVLLNFKQSFDLSTETATAPYQPIDPQARERYIRQVASGFKYTFEEDPVPTPEALFELFTEAVPRLQRKQKELRFFEDINLVFDVADSGFACLNLRDSQPLWRETIDGLEPYHRFKLDPRLLKRALQGPRYANWNNIEIGALVEFARQPDVYRMDVHTLINALHV